MSLPAIHEYDPARLPGDPWFRRFADPLRAYSNLPMLVRSFRAHACPAPAATAEDYVHYAWAVAQGRKEMPYAPEP